MPMPFPGMDPYLEHPILWTAVHARLINVISQQLAPRLRPRYITSIEERVLIDIPGSQRIPDVWIQKAADRESVGGTSLAMAEPVILEIPRDELKEHFIEIMDRYQDLKVVTVIEVASPANKASGEGRAAYLTKRQVTFASDTHLVEVDLSRTGNRFVDYTETQLKALGVCPRKILPRLPKLRRLPNSIFPKIGRSVMLVDGIYMGTVAKELDNGSYGEVVS